MTTIAFAKYHGLGNDFIIVDALDDGTLAGTDWPGLAPRWCDRRLGIGADGILVLVPGASDTDLEMRVFNADGTRAQMCGNGVRCVALYMADRRGHRGKGLRISTLAGRIDVTWATGLGGKRAVRVDMGPPGLESADLPVRTNRDRVVDVPLGELAGESTDGSGSDAKKIQVALEAFDAASEGGTARVTCVSMGNPHAVVFVRDAGATPMESIGPVVEHLGAFPDRMNVHAAQAVGRG
ncbi:MAG TPA: diaminopimelate epimerase, partial [Phycisphaerales bacterium]|nr:diaminopimelate epimerase [Phycisphaerales bacterium]